MNKQPVARIESGQDQPRPPEIVAVSAVISAREAAAALGVNEKTIRRAISLGELAATKHGRSFRIARAALDEWRANRNQPQPARAQLRLVTPSATVETAPATPTLIPLFGGEQLGRAALPSPLTTFVGRSRELASLEALLRDEGVRLVTLTGPGGVGKTRLALHVAKRVASDFADGVVFVALASVRDPALIPSAVAQALGLRESDVLPPAARITAALRDRRLLLVFDNFEHLADDASRAFVVDLLMACPGVTALVTSRTLLRRSGEHAVVVPPLALADDGDGKTARRQDGKTATRAVGAMQASPASASPAGLAEVEGAEAVQLFVDRARAAWPDFALTAENAAAVAAICARVDGLPLAIELAAARSAVLSPATLLARFERRLPLLTGGPHDQPDRLRTMRDAIAWSYDLLDATTRTLFRRLAVFAGGFTIEGVEGVALNEAPPPSPPERSDTPSVLDSLAVLLTGNLVQRLEQPDGETPLSGGDSSPQRGEAREGAGHGGEPRFGMLEMVREFALEQLIAAGEEDAARAAHAAWCLDFMAQARPELRVATAGTVLDRIETEHDNLRGALTWTLTHDPELALRLASELGPFWAKRCHWSEGRSWLKRALQTGAGQGTVARVVVTGQAGMLAGEQSDNEEARRFLQEGLALADDLGDIRNAANALRGLGILASNESDFAAADTYFSQALERYRAEGDQSGIARALNDLGLVAARRGEQDRAIAYQEEALPISRALGDEWQVGIILGNLGEAYYDRGDYARGEVLSQEALALARQLGDTIGVAINLYNLGNCALQSGDPGGAIEHYRETLTLTNELGEQHLGSRTLDRLGVALHQTGLSRQAARLFGAAAALREAAGDSLFSEEDASLTARFQEVRDELGEATFVAAWESVRSLPLARALAEAAEFATAALTLARTAPAPAIAGLTRRELDVLRLLAAGHTDKEIADVLYVTRRSASKYVSAVLGKLGVTTRTAAAIVVRDGLV